MTPRYFKKLLKEWVKKLPYYGLIVDEMTDISTTSQLLIYIKFIDFDEKASMFYVATEYLDLISLKSSEAEDLIVYSWINQF